MSKLFGRSSGEFPDLSEGFDRSAIRFDDFGRYGIHGRVLCSSYDQVQSLLALGTDTGLVYVLGQDGVEVVYKIPSNQPAAHISLQRTHLTVIDARNALYSWNIDERDHTPVASHYVRGVVTTVYAEPSLDWLILGMKDGTIVVWDTEAEQMNTEFRIKNLYFEKQEEDRVMEYEHALPRFHVSPVVTISMHPTNLGILLIGYPDGVVLYSVKQGVVKNYFEINAFRPRPLLTCATFSPDGQVILAAYDNGLFAFFDLKEPDMPVQLRTLGETDVNTSLRSFETPDPVRDVLWACRETDPTDTFLLIAGGSPDGLQGITLLDYGKLPVRSTEWARFFAAPSRQRIFPNDPHEEVIRLQSLGSASPYYNHHAPRAVLALNLSGRVSTLVAQTGAECLATEQHPTLRFVDPPTSALTLVNVNRDVFQALEAPLRSMRSTQPLLIGGAPAKRRLRSFDSRTLMYTLHGSVVRVSDISHVELADPPFLEIDLAAILPGERPIEVHAAAKEVLVVHESGAVSIHTLTLDGSDRFAPGPWKVLEDRGGLPTPVAQAQNWLFPIDEGGEASGSYGAVSPNYLLRARQGEVSSAHISQVGFIVVCYTTGLFCVVDMRGPAVIFASDASLVVEKVKDKALFRRSSHVPTAAKDEYATSSTILAQNVEGRLALVVVLGTSSGRILRYDILREQNGTFSVILLDITGPEPGGAITSILGCASTGRVTTASGVDLRDLQSAVDHQDAIIAVTKSAIHAFVGVKRKVYRAELRQGAVRQAGLVRLHGSVPAVVLEVVTPSGVVEVFSVPQLKFVGTNKLPTFDQQSSLPMQIAENGDVVAPTARTELGLFNIFGSGVGLRDVPPDALYDATKQPTIPRPVITTWAWLTGTQYIKPADFDLILTGGAERPLSRKARERLEAQEKQRLLLEKRSEAEQRAAQRQTVLPAARNAEGYNARGANVYGQMERNVAERGERVSQLNDTMDNIGRAANGWLGEIDKLSRDMKKKAAISAAKSYLPF